MTFAAQHIKQARNHLRRADPVMKRIIGQVGPFTAKAKRERFRTLAASIVSQQISGKAARSIWGRLEELLSPAQITSESIGSLDLEALRSVGISRQKASYLLDLACKVSDSTVALNTLGRKSDEEVIVELTQVKGIGRWTAQMFLMFSLARLDVLPTDDLGVRNAIKNEYRLRELPNAHRIIKIAAPWRPYATVASWYLWQSLELDKS